MTKSAKFWDKIAESYAKKPIEDQSAYEKKLEVTQQYLMPDFELLELGCGTGSTAIIHAPYVKHIRAVDISANMLAIARRKADTEKIENITFEQSGLKELKVKDNSLDGVLALSILHLIDNKEEMMTRIHTMLKPNGIFVSSTVCLQGTMWSLCWPILKAGGLLGLLPLVKFFSAKQMLKAITKAGFDIEYEWQPKGPVLFVVAKKP